MTSSPLVLASGSPQRRAILRQLGVAFSVVVPEVDELDEGDPEGLVLENARRKARAVDGERVLGVDTAVVLDGRPLGKPVDAAEAERFLQDLAGREHQVLSGFCAREAGRELVGVGGARVRFRTLSAVEVGDYVATGEWRGRAGGYAVQGRGALLVKHVAGDFWAVVGLPVAAIASAAPAFLRPDPVDAASEAEKGRSGGNLPGGAEGVR